MFWAKLKIAAAWCRQYWRWLIFVIAILASYLLGRKDKDKLKEQAKLAKEMYIKEKEVIERAHEEEIKKREEAQIRYSEAVKKIEEKYEKDKWDLTFAKKEEVKKLIKKAKRDPEEIDRILEQELGIKNENK